MNQLQKKVFDWPKKIIVGRYKENNMWVLKVSIKSGGILYQFQTKIEQDFQESCLFLE
jgi:hypothetical protein